MTAAFRCLAGQLEISPEKTACIRYSLPDGQPRIALFKGETDMESLCRSWEAFCRENSLETRCADLIREV